MGGKHRWAPAFLTACHHIYFIIYYCIISYLANKIVVGQVIRANNNMGCATCATTCFANICENFCPCIGLVLVKLRSS